MNRRKEDKLFIVSVLKAKTASKSFVFSQFVGCFSAVCNIEMLRAKPLDQESMWKT